MMVAVMMVFVVVAVMVDPGQRASVRLFRHRLKSCTRGLKGHSQLIAGCLCSAKHQGFPCDEARRS